MSDCKLVGMDTLISDKMVKNEHSFSLIELIIVSIIISILAMLALVNFKGFYTKGEFENTVDGLVSFIRQSQTYAVTEWARKAMVVLPDEKRLVINLSEDDIREFKLPDHYSIESDVVKIVFDSSGGFDLVDADDPDVDIKTNGWIKIKDDITGDKARIELWGFGGNVKVESISLGR